jgi:transposase-like protein
MRLQLILPHVEPAEMKLPSVCPYEDCQGRHFRYHQEVSKAVKDTKYEAVSADRYECLRCKRTFRVYPQGVTCAQTSQRVKGLGVLVYLLGLSYGAASLALEGLGVYMSKSSVYEGSPDLVERELTEGCILVVEPYIRLRA